MEYNKYPYASLYQPGVSPEMQQPQQIPQVPLQQNYPPAYQNTPTPELYYDATVGNVLRQNRGKLATFYFSYSNSNEWKDKVYKGVIEEAASDYIIVSDPKTGKRYLLQVKYLTWVEFDEEVDYTYPYPKPHVSL